jgi:tetratricopeptide (TPR) repeat protein
MSNNKHISIVLFLLIFGITVRASAQTNAAPSMPSHESGLSQSELEIWNDPAFKKRFAESYIAETEIEPRVTPEEHDKMKKILALISSNKMNKAARLLEKSRGDAFNALYDFMLANIFFQQEKLDQAAGLYQIAVEKYPKFRRAWRNLGLIYVRQGEFEKVTPALTRVIELGGGDALTYGLLGFAYTSTENYLSAETSYRMAIMLDPVKMDWKIGLARSLFKQERYAEAATLCGRLIVDQPDRADLWLLQANAYVGLKQPLRAAENYEFVDRLGKSTADSLNILGDIYTNEGLYEIAVNYYIRAMEKTPQHNPDRAIRAAKVLTASGALKEARQLIEHIETLHGDQLGTDGHKDLLKLRARLAVAEGTGDEEARVLEEIVALDPLDGEALILLGQHAYRSGNTEKAAFYYERAASIEKYEADAKVRHSQLLVGKGNYDEALPLLRRAQQLKPRDEVQKYLEQVEHIARSRK